MKSVFPAVTGSLAVLAAFDQKAHRYASKVVKDVYRLDHEVALAATGLLTGQDRAALSLAASHPRAARMEEVVNETAAEMMRAL